LGHLDWPLQGIHTPAGSPDMIDMRLVDNKLIVVWSISGGLHIWDTRKEEHPQQVNIRFSPPISDLKISVDGSKVFFLDMLCVRALSTQTAKVVSRVGVRGELSNDPLIVDGSRVWVQTRRSSIQGWDFGTLDSTPIPLANNTPDPNRSWLGIIKGTEGGGHWSIQDHGYNHWGRALSDT